MSFRLMKWADKFAYFTIKLLNFKHSIVLQICNPLIVLVQAEDLS